MAQLLEIDYERAACELVLKRRRYYGAEIGLKGKRVLARVLRHLRQNVAVLQYFRVA